MAHRPHKTARPLTRTALRSGMIGFALSACTVAGLQLHAQAIAGHNSNAPVN